MTWRYIVQRISGPSKGQFLEWNLPLSAVKITTALGTNWLAAEIKPEFNTDRAEDGLPLLDKWSTAIWAEENGDIRGGGIVVDNTYAGHTRKIECMGYGGYPDGIPYVGTYAQTGVDPVDVVKHVWAHMQAQTNGDLGVTVRGDVTPIRVGTPTVEGDRDSGPYTLNWWETPDCGKVIKDLAKGTPFETEEAHEWDGNVIRHYINVGYPRLGRRRNDLRFVLGENLQVVPTITDDGTEFANEFIGLGAGEGREMVRATVPVADHRLRRVRVVPDKTAQSSALLASRLRLLMASVDGDHHISEVQVLDHPNAVLGSWRTGDEIYVQATTDWEQVGVWCRIVSTTVNPESSNRATLRLERA